MRRFPLATSVLVACVVFCIPSANAAPILDSIIINGSFEEGPPPFENQDIDILSGSTEITGWLVTGGGIDLMEDPWDVSDGVRAVDLDGRDALSGGIQQTFATTAGQKYRVWFDLSGNPGTFPGAGPPVVKEVRVSVDGFTHDYSHDSTGQTIESLTWQRIAFSFAASDTLTTLSFMSLTPFPNSYGPLIDNVGVAPVPEPATMSLVGMGLAAALYQRHRRVRRVTSR